MSYILDALKKSEQERGNGSIPSVQTIHSSSLNYHQEKRLLWPWILIIALIANMAILFYFLKPVNKEHNVSAVEPHAPASPVSTPPAQALEKNNFTPVPINPMPITIEERNVHTAPATADNFTATPVTTPVIETPVVDIDELPANIRQQIPAMVFSAHVYSTAARQRSLVINDRFMEEGDSVTPELTLFEITPGGAIFDYRGYRFKTSVISGWGAR
ncbi:MAG: general secretion pathway protein GspB [Gammaproteobacteria bacterium]|nr:general secretion pathway protein GspB [Gammaproteobacteria bacterium]